MHYITMKKVLSITLMLLCTFMVQAADMLKEDFSTLAKKTYGNNAEETVTLPSGEWKAFKMQIKENNSIKQFTFNGTTSYLITPALDDPGKITVDWGSGGSNKLTVNYSINGGAWQELTQQNSGGSGAKSFGMKTGLDGQTNVRFKFSGSSSNTYVSKVVIKSASVVPVDPDDPTYVTEGAWVPVEQFPTALKKIYIAPDGDDINGDGTRENPWCDLQKAINAAEPGTHIICRGGTYSPKLQSDGKYTIRIKTSGTAEQPIIIRCEDGEKPIFDFIQQLIDLKNDPKAISQKDRMGERGMTITGSHWWIFGIHITHAADNGMKLEGSYNRIERCEFSYNLDTGLQLGFGHDFKNSIEQSYGRSDVSSNDGTWCAYNDIIDCDSHHNCDCDMNYGGDADGFACKMHPGKGNRFIRCRAWRNADDTWDLFETDYSVVIAECWAWMPANAEDHLWVKEYLTPVQNFNGNGNGIKLGGNGTGGSSKGIHYVYNSIAFGCKDKGFDENNHGDGHKLIGCLAFDNGGYSFMFKAVNPSKTWFYNNVCLGKQEIKTGCTDDYNAIISPVDKGWSNHLKTGADGVSDDNYISLEEEDALAPRDIYGGLPRRFGRLNADPENPLVDAGDASYDDDDPVWQQLVADYPFLKRTITGSARDLGPYERPASNPTAISNISDNAKFTISPAKVIKNGRFLIEKGGKAYSAQGQIIF